MSALKCHVTKCPFAHAEYKLSCYDDHSCTVAIRREHAALKRLVRDMIIRFKILGCWCAVEEFSKRAKRLVGNAEGQPRREAT